MRTLLSIICLIALSAAADDRIALKLATLADIARERRAALISNAITDHDSTSALRFQQWEQDWILAGSVKGAPTPRAVLRKVRDEQDGTANVSQPVRAQANREPSAGSRR